MKRRLLLLLLLLPGAVASGGPAAPAAPNVVLILADDLGYGDLSCFGQRRFATPHLDRLASEGMRLTSFYAASPVCAPSRCGLLTGRHMGHASVRGNLVPAPGGGELRPLGLEASDRTIAAALQERGYATAAIGKWGLGEPGTAGVPWKHGFEEFLGFLNQRHAHTHYPEWIWDGPRRIELPANANGARGEYVHERFLERALEFMRRSRDRPFFLYYATTLPHDEMALPAAEEARVAWQEGSSPPASGRERIYAAMVSRLDREVGELLAELKRLGIERETLVVFTSDNGPAQGRRPDDLDSAGGLRGRKQDLYEGGIRVPFIARWPGRIPPGSSRQEPAAAWDLPATLAAAAGVAWPEAPGGGISLLPSLAGGETDAPERTLYWEFLLLARGEARRAVRRGDWKALRFGRDGPLELYHLEKDPRETRNVAAEHPDWAAELGARMDELREESPRYPLFVPARAGDRATR